MRPQLIFLPREIGATVAGVDEDCVCCRTEVRVARSDEAAGTGACNYGNILARCRRVGECRCAAGESELGARKVRHAADTLDGLDGRSAVLDAGRACGHGQRGAVAIALVVHGAHAHLIQKPGREAGQSVLEGRGSRERAGVILISSGHGVDRNCGRRSNTGKGSTAVPRRDGDLGRCYCDCTENAAGMALARRCVLICDEEAVAHGECGNSGPSNSLEIGVYE